VPESFKKQIVQRVGRNLTDIMILRLIHTQPTWGYNIIKAMETDFEIQLGHGALYPLLNSLEKSGFLESKKEKHGGRIRKIYKITPRGIQFLDAYYEFLKEQTEVRDSKGTKKYD
jgi:PadR family transcriptional regulator PadR